MTPSLPLSKNVPGTPFRNKKLYLNKPCNDCSLRFTYVGDIRTKLISKQWKKCQFEIGHVVKFVEAKEL
jgi:hypothetical protein